MPVGWNMLSPSTQRTGSRSQGGRGGRKERLGRLLSKVTGREFRYSPAVRAQSEDMALMFEWFVGPGYVADIKILRRDFQT